MSSKKKNAFMQFAEELANKNGFIGSKPKMVEYARPHWEKMGDEERKKYVDLAKKYNMMRKSRQEDVENAIAVNQISKGGNNAEKIQIVEDLVTNLTLNNGILSHTFFLMSVNYFNHTLEGDYYVPAELAISKFSLNLGLMDVYHIIISPDEIPYGYQFEAKNYSEGTHGLPLPPSDLGESDHRVTYTGILKFLLGDNVTVRECNQGRTSTKNLLSVSIARGCEIPKIFTKMDQMEIVKSSLDYLCSVVNDVDATISGGAFLPLYSIEHLLFNWKTASTMEKQIEPPPKSIHITNLYFSNDIYEYHRNIACDFHEECDRGNYCNKSIVIRWVFQFCRFLCDDYNIQMMAGKHLPAKEKVNVIYSNMGLTDNRDRVRSPEARKNKPAHRQISPRSPRSPRAFINVEENPWKKPEPRNNSNFTSPIRSLPTTTTTTATTTPVRSPWKSVTAQKPEEFSGVLLSQCENEFPAIGSHHSAAMANKKRSTTTANNVARSGATSPRPAIAGGRPANPQSPRSGILEPIGNVEAGIQQRQLLRRAVKPMDEKQQQQQQLPTRSPGLSLMEIDDSDFQPYEADQNNTSEESCDQHMMMLNMGRGRPLQFKAPESLNGGRGTTSADIRGRRGAGRGSVGRKSSRGF